MKKIICLILTAILLITPATAAFAKQGGNNSQQSVAQQRIKEKKQSFKINGSPIIKYGKFKLPIAPITKGMGATVTFDKATAVLTVKKGTTEIVIDFKNSTVTVNGVADTKAGIFTASNSKKTIVLIQYIAKALGIKVSVDDDDVIVTVPGLDLPTSVAVIPVGGTVVANTLNSTNLSLTAFATIKAGQATGGKAELYVGSKLVATDSAIAATDTTVNFTTADETPVNAELQTAVPAGGVVTVKLYNASNNSVTSAVANPTLTVDYAAPSVTSITSAVYNATANTITLNVTGSSTVGDKVDVTKISLFNATLATNYQLTNTTGTGSVGAVIGQNTILINLGTVDAQCLTGFSSSTVLLSIAAGSLLSDAAGNASAETTVISVPLTAAN